MIIFSRNRLIEAQRKLQLKEVFKPDKSNWNEYQDFIYSSYLDTISYRKIAENNTYKTNLKRNTAE